MRILLAGEGRTELGDWANEPQYRPDSPQPGVIQALLCKVREEGWSVNDAILWKNIHKLRAGGHSEAEKHNVMALVHIAWENNFDAVAFTRDRDGQRGRQKQVEEAIQEAATMHPNGPKIIGAMAIEEIEAWLLALQGQRGCEDISNPKNRLSTNNTAGKVKIVEKASLEDIPDDATQLLGWLQRASNALEVILK